MIATLSGKLELHDPGHLIVDTAGVGYEVFVPLSTYYRMPSLVPKSNRKFARWCVKTLLPYGFASAAEKQAFLDAKIAERIVRELRDKIKELNLAAPLRMDAASSNGHSQAGSLIDDAAPGRPGWTAGCLPSPSNRTAGGSRPDAA